MATIYNHGSASAMNRIISRPGMDPSQRLKTYGRIQPFGDERFWWERLFRR